MCRLGQFLRQRGHWQVTIIPHMMTHAMPIHLAPLCWTDDLELFYEHFAVAYAPCVQLALATALRPRPERFIRGELPAFLLADPKEDLPATRSEQKGVHKQLAQHPWPAAPVPSYSVVGRSANLDVTLEKLPEAGIIGLATHARFIGGDPYGSGLYFATGNNKELKLWTVDEIFASSHLKKSPIVILSACESGMSHFDESSEIVALPPAFVCIGAAAVLGSLWPVEDVSTSFLVERFTYHLLDPGETPPTALGEACKDVRRISREEALDRCDEILWEMEERGAPLKDNGEAYRRLASMRQRIASGPERPFESPLVWGGFFITGCGWRSGGGKVVVTRSPYAGVAMIEGTAKVRAATELFRQGKYEEVVTLLREAIATLDGLWLGRALLLLGDSLYRQPTQRPLFDFAYWRQQAEEALGTLDRAYKILEAQGDTEATSYCVSLIKKIKSELQSQK